MSHYNDSRNKKKRRMVSMEFLPSITHSHKEDKLKPKFQNKLCQKKKRNRQVSGSNARQITIDRSSLDHQRLVTPHPQSKH